MSPSPALVSTFLDLKTLRLADFSHNLKSKRNSFPVNANQISEDLQSYRPRLGIAKELREGHWLRQVIESPLPIDSMAVVRHVLGTLENTLHIKAFANGAIPASTNPLSSYSFGSWRRDTAIMQLASLALSKFSLDHETSGDAHKALLHSLIKTARFDNRPEQRARFMEFILCPEMEAKHKFQSEVLRLPLNKMTIAEDGRLGGFVEWGHNQLDGFGAGAYMYFKAANEGLLDLKKLDQELVQQNPENAQDSIFTIYLEFLHHVQFWDQIDLGPWENIRAHQRASSVGLCVAAFKEAKKYFELNDWNYQSTCRVNEQVNLQTILEESIQKGERVLSLRLPSDGRSAVETGLIADDAALSFLLLINPGLSLEQESSILKTISKLVGPYGIRRMLDHHDLFMGTDHISNRDGHGEWGLNSADHQAAQWTLFDPIIATHFYRRFIASQGEDYGSFLFADQHAKRTLSQITMRHHLIDAFSNDGAVLTHFVSAGVLPEARAPMSNSKIRSEILNSSEGLVQRVTLQDNQQAGGHVWIPNTNSPLHMANAACFIMFTEQMRAIEVLNKL